MKKIKWIDREIYVKSKVMSIFDSLEGGTYDENGDYFVVRRNYITGRCYAITRETESDFLKQGHTLDEDEYAEFNGECVRGMTDYEEYLYSIDNLKACVDCWNNIKANITERQAHEFYRDLCGAVNGDKTCQGILSVEAIAERMEISVSKANAYCQAMFKYGITEKQGGGVVV